jgi:hypothetical protein
MDTVYDAFDSLIDLCVDKRLDPQAQKLRDIRDDLPSDKEEPDGS